jgi:hypothetical protein
MIVYVYKKEHVIRLYTLTPKGSWLWVYNAISDLRTTNKI